MVNSVKKKKKTKKKRLFLDPQEGERRGREAGTYSWAQWWACFHPWWDLWWICLSAPARFHDIWSAPWSPDCPGKSHWTPKWGVPSRLNDKNIKKKSCLFFHSPQLCMYASVRPHKFQFRSDRVVSKFHLQPPLQTKKKSFPAPLSSSLPLWFSPLLYVKLAVVWLLLVAAGYFTAARCGPEAADLPQTFRGMNIDTYSVSHV